MCYRIANLHWECQQGKYPWFFSEFIVIICILKTLNFRCMRSKKLLWLKWWVRRSKARSGTPVRGRATPPPVQAALHSLLPSQNTQRVLERRRERVIFWECSMYVTLNLKCLRSEILLWLKWWVRRSKARSGTPVRGRATPPPVQAALHSLLPNQNTQRVLERRRERVLFWKRF